MVTFRVVAAFIAVAACPLPAGAREVRVEQDDGGWKLVVDEKPYVVKGVNWRYTPVGRNYSFDAWRDLPREVCERLIDEDAELMKRMGINTIRLIDQTGEAKFVVERFHEKHGIRTIINHFAGRYGVTVNGQNVAQTNYADPATRDAIKADVKKQIETYKDVPGVLAYAFGNENNYGLEWVDAAVQNLPEGERQEAKARHLYTLFNDLAVLAHEVDPTRPTILVNGDLQYVSLIDELCKDVDILGVNSYRGRNFGDLWQRAAEIGKPVCLIEFGADAFDARSGKENQKGQADWVGAQLDDVRGNSHPDLGGKSAGAGTALGGCLFQWVDEWWKFGQSYDLDVHNTDSTWSNGGYYDFDEKNAGRNNMNEEWWGLCALDPDGSDGLHARKPRAVGEAIAKRWADAPAPASVETR